MFNIFYEIANQSDLFPHLKDPAQLKHTYICEDCPTGKPATHSYKFTDDDELEAYTTWLCDDCKENNLALGVLQDYEDLGNPNL